MSFLVNLESVQQRVRFKAQWFISALALQLEFTLFVLVEK